MNKPLAWPERLALVIFALVVGVSVLFGIAAAVGDVIIGIKAVFVLAFWLSLFIVLPIWVTCRLLDLVMGGPMKRARAVTTYSRGPVIEGRLGR